MNLREIFEVFIAGLVGLALLITIFDIVLRKLIKCVDKIQEKSDLK